jgi:hypothetical protein
VPLKISASPSVMSRSGSVVSRASRAPMVASVDIGLAMISPAPLKISAHAIAQYSALVTVSLLMLSVEVMPAPLQTS